MAKTSRTFFEQKLHQKLGPGEDEPAKLNAARWFNLSLIGFKLFKLVKLLAALKFAKPVITLGTMSISALAYTAMTGPWLAIGLVLMIFVHEIGHVLAARAKGIKVSAPVFIPFVGALITMKPVRCRDTEAYISIAGPVIGGLGAAAVLGIWALVPAGSSLSNALFFTSYLGVVINAFNMIPISPLDGGRITQAVSRHVKILGIILLAGLTAALRSPGLLLLWILVVDDLSATRPAFKLLAVVGIYAIMATLFAFGFGSEPFYAKAVDLVLGAVILLLSLGQYKAWQGLSKEKRAQYELILNDAKRKDLSARRRLKWLLLYTLVLAALLGLLVFQMGFIENMTSFATHRG